MFFSILYLSRFSLKIKLLIFFYLCFYISMLLQMLTTHNLTSFILFFYVGVLVLGLLPFEVLLCDKQFKNALVDTILLAFIFLVSAFCYIQAWKAKVKSLIEEIYSLLSKLHCALEAKISLIQA